MPADNVRRIVPLRGEWTKKENLEKQIEEQIVSSSYLSLTEHLTGRTSNSLLYF